MLVLMVSCGQNRPNTADASNTEETNNPKIDVQEWPRMPAHEFGCMLETLFGYKDPYFNCSLKDYENHGDPCVNFEEYYEGPEFPEHLVKKINPKLKSIQLSWEFGQLQSVWFIFENKLSVEQIYAEFGIDPNSFPDNIYAMFPSEGSLQLDGFEHMGAGDLDCKDLENDVATFMNRVKYSIRKEDKEWMADHILYPISATLNGDQKISIDNKQKFISNFEQIFYPAFKNKINESDVNNLFTNQYGTMLGDGEIWVENFSKNKSKDYKIYVINN